MRIPAAFNGLVGLKTTNGSIPTEGVVPLSITLDTLGPMTRTVADAWHVWQGLAGQTVREGVPKVMLEGKRFLAPQTILQLQLDPVVADAFLVTCDKLSDAGVTVEYIEMPQLEEVFDLYQRYGSFAGSESLALYEDLLVTQGDRLDPRVSMRIANMTWRQATDYIRLHLERRRVTKEVMTEYDFDAIIGPTVPILPPPISALVTDEAYLQANALCLRNTMPFNFFGTPAISVPCSTTTEGFSVGLMLATRVGEDAKALALGAALESLLANGE